MSLVEGLASLLRQMALGELALALAAILAYAIAINGSFGSGLRSGAGSVAFAFAVGFTTLSPAWTSAIVFLALAVVAIAAFAASAWALSSVLGLGEARVATPALADDVAAVPAAPYPVLGFAAQTRPVPL